MRAFMLVIGLVLAACSQLGTDRPGTLSGGDVYMGEDAVTITITTEQVGCCYIEGSLRYARLDGPSSFDWAVDDGSGSRSFASESFVVGVQTSSVQPGDYVLVAWEQVCSGNCGILEPPSHECSLEFSAPPGEHVEIVVTYPIPRSCNATLSD